MNDLMTLEDIAQMFGRTIARTKSILLKLPGFPPVAPTSTRGHRCWVRAEVRAFKALAPEIIQAERQKAHEALISRCAEIEAKTAANRRHHHGKRRAAMLARTPPWADLAAIEAVYREATRLESVTGVDHHVDHIIPLQGRKVSGLHVAANLRAIPRLENLTKHNRFEVEA